ncbi:hypothetical protein L9F63_023065, partial [Diploptera punctata]
FLITTNTSEASHHVEFNLSANYDKLETPGESEGFGQSQFVVSLKIRIRDIISVEEFHNIMQLELDTIMKWPEPRITFLHEEELEKGRRYPVESDEAEQFWVPEFYVGQTSSSSTEAKNNDISYLLLRADKTVLQIKRINIIIKCRFEFELYPLDVQHCAMDIMNPLHPAEEVTLSWLWDRPPVIAFTKKSNTELVLPEYTVKLQECTKSFLVEHVSGNVSAIRFWLILKRQLMAHILETYVPTGLFVAMSWGSFLVKPDIVPGRMVLLVTNLLSLVTLFEASRVSAPPAVGIKFVDIWVLSCIGFVFLALLEYAIILFQIRKMKPPTTAANKTKCRERVKTLQLFTLNQDLHKEHHSQ